MKGDTVAHLRSELFHPTETFIYQYVRGARSVRPVLVTDRRIGRDAFPFDGPTLELHRSWTPGAVLRSVIRRLLRRPAPWSFADPRTFRLLDRQDVNVLHAHFGQDGWRALPVARQTGLPLITSFYGFDAWMLPRREEWWERFAALFAEGALFLAEGPAMAERLKAIGCPEPKVAVQRLAVDLDRYPFHHRRPVGDRPARLLFVGRFVEKKGLEYALEAVHRLRTDHALELLVVGDGERRPAIEATLDHLELRDHVRLLGMADHATMIRLLGEADLLLQPSVVADDGDTEGGAPTTLLEAQATGLPVVATRHQDIPNVVAEDAGVLVEERDADALADAIDGLLRAPDRWAAMGDAGRRFVEEQHGIGPLIDQLETRYRTLAGED